MTSETEKHTQNALSKLESFIISDEEFTAREKARNDEKQASEQRMIAKHGNADVRRLVKAGFGRREAEVSINGVLEGEDWLKSQVEAIRIIDKKGMVVLSGDCGTGKTVMAASIAHRWMASRTDAMYFRIVDFFRSIKDRWGKSGGESEDQYIKRISNVGLLVLDEIQDRTNAGGDWENATLNNLLDLRYSGMRPTLLITNITGDSAAKCLPRSVVSRIEQTGGFIALNWASYRSK